MLMGTRCFSSRQIIYLVLEDCDFLKASSCKIHTGSHSVDLHDSYLLSSLQVIYSRSRLSPLSSLWSHHGPPLLIIEAIAIVSSEYFQLANVEAKHVEKELDANITMVAQIWQQNSTSTFDTCSSYSEQMNRILWKKTVMCFLNFQLSDKKDKFLHSI